jgi:tetrapyrrole methylase family protein/MazG family protein
LEKTLQTIGTQFIRLVDIMALLRSEKGCPWDREQTHKSLCQHLLEEAYEVIESIDNEQAGNLADELGDLLLQVIFHAQIAAEENRFHIGDVIQAITEKLVRRHPHVFGEVEIKTAEEQTVHWEMSKLSKEGKNSAIDGVPRNLPALLRAYRMQSKAAAVGFDWPDIGPVWEKVEEELEELRGAYGSGVGDKIENELGDLLFSVVNLSRFLKENPEDALRKAITKFEVRFKKVETELAAKNKSLADVSLEEMDAIWDEVKQREESSPPAGPCRALTSPDGP